MDVYVYETHFDTPFVPAILSILILFKTRLFATRYLFSHQKEKGKGNKNILPSSFYACF